MRLTRAYVDAPLAQGARITLPESAAQHLLKVLRLGMDSRDVLARFEVERQAMAMMDHTSIATVFDAGATATGRPYFVMELVDGESITAYCAGRALPLRERLDLFLQSCAAIEHAHQRAIIHRDIKASNVSNFFLAPAFISKLYSMGEVNTSHKLTLCSSAADAILPTVTFPIPLVG